MIRVKMPRFVLLLHETPPGYPRPTHYDLMLERGDVLWTWAMAELPTGDNKIAAERLGDHRRAYLEFEGAIAGDRGSVRRIDWGDYELLSESRSEIELHLDGQALRGKLKLTQDADSQRWWVWLSDD